MKYFRVLFNDHIIPSLLLSDKPDLYGVKEGDVNRGELIKGWDKRITFYSCQDATPQDVLWGLFSWFIMSPRVIKALNEEGANGIQWLPVNIKRLDSKEIYDYHLLNVLKCFSVHDIMDFSKSKSFWGSTTNDNDKLKGMYRFAFYHDKIMQIDIFKIKEESSEIFVSQKIRGIFRKNKFTGWGFDECTLL